MKIVESRKDPWQGALVRMLEAAGKAADQAAQLPAGIKKKVLLDTASELGRSVRAVMNENRRDLTAAEKGRLHPAMIDRLTLNPARIAEMAEGLRMVASLPDPVGRLESSWKRPNGLRISKIRVPMGVILIIYESRPNVTVECASLCFKSGNAVILRGGREAFYSNRALARIFVKALLKRNLPKGCVSFVGTSDRAAVDFLLKQEGKIHLVIPRGGQDLIRKVVELSRIPVIKHYQGICHVYVDRRADLKKALDVVYNAKMQRPGVCNAMETLLVHKAIAGRFLPIAGERLKAGGCELRVDPQSRKFLPWAKPAQKGDYGHEFLDKILAVKTVGSAEEAMNHIRDYGSGHTDAIMTEDPKTAAMFKRRVDSASVMINASTRFSDGFQYGFGAEIGISTDKIHARGPMGLEGLTSYKYVVEGNGQIRT